jgi:hypothetical protein
MSFAAFLAAGPAAHKNTIGRSNRRAAGIGRNSLTHFYKGKQDVLF